MKWLKKIVCKFKGHDPIVFSFYELSEKKMCRKYCGRCGKVFFEKESEQWVHSWER